MGTYEGWTNAETALIARHIDNDAAELAYWKRRADRLRDVERNTDGRELAVELLEKALSVFVDAHVNALGPQGMIADLLQCTLDRVEWREIAEHFLAE